MRFKKIRVNLDNEGGGRQLELFAVGIVRAVRALCSLADVG